MLNTSFSKGKLDVLAEAELIGCTTNGMNASFYILYSIFYLACFQEPPS